MARLGRARQGRARQGSNTKTKGDTTLKLRLTMTGTKPMLQHNARLANPRDPYTRKLKEITSKRKKTDEDLITISLIEAQAGAYETADGLLGISATSVWRCIYDAAKAFKLGEDIKRGFVMDDVVEPLLVGGSTVPVEEFLLDHAHVDYRIVVVNRKRMLRSRPIVPIPWSAELTAEIDDQILNPHLLDPVYERAGRLVGVGDWRPRYGTFVLSCEEL